jgi:serine/threonine protein kinase/Flp pilus assembly protein TadD
MTDQAEQIESVFAAALQKASPQERAAYLDQACAENPALRGRVEALLKAHDQAGSFLQDQPAGQPQTVDCEPITEGPGTLIGPYKLLEQIGEGGFGVVFMAEQQPVRRKVALKVIKPGMDTRQVIARFEAERQALALMDHPHIARVLDAGATVSGRPYFVMELVKGIPITAFCDQAQLTARERLELFVAVCQAVQHAHQKGIIHRDLKPSNILVTLHDDKPVVKVIDFGIAKATGQQLTEKTLFTGFAQMAGTPLYMSPEQAALSGLDVDTRADIYALGVLLYELLTGTTPFDRERLKRAAFEEIRRIIREEEPPRPSTRVSTLGPSSASVSAQRKTDPKHLSLLLRGDLDWVVMKCLEKERGRRYETANGLARDMQRYLADLPVEARPPSALYRLRKFSRRNKSALLMGAVLAVALLLVLGVVAGSIGYVVRDRAARQAEVEQERIARQAETGGAVEEALKESAFFRKQSRWPEALAAAQKAAAILKSGEGSSTLQERVREVVADMEMIKKLDEINLRKPTSFSDVAELDRADPAYAEAFRAYGIDMDALTPEEAAKRIRARSIQHELVAALDDWTITRAALTVPDRRGRDHLQAVSRVADPADLWRNRLRDTMGVGPDKAKALLEALATEAAVAELQPVTAILVGYRLNSLRAFAEAAAFLGKAQRLHPDNFWINHDLGWSLQAMGRKEESLRYFTAALALRPQNPYVHISLAEALAKTGQLDEARAAYREAVRLKPSDPGAYHNYALAMLQKGAPDDAIAAARESLRLGPNRARSRSILHKALLLKGGPDAVTAEYREVSKRYRETIEKEPDSPAAIAAADYLLRHAAMQGEPAEQVTKWAEFLAKSAEPNGSLAQRGTATRLAEALAVQKPYAPIAVKYATQAESMVGPKDSAEQQVRVLEALAASLRGADKAAEANAVDERVAKLLSVLDAEYRTKMSRFKPTAFEGHKVKSDRVVVMELFTCAECPPCLAADLAFEGLTKTYKPEDVVLLQYHTHIPRPDPMTNADTEARWAYYRRVFPGKIRGVPTSLFNGKPEMGGGGGLPQAGAKYKQYREAIERLLEEPAETAIALTARQEGDTMTMTANVSNVPEPGESKRLRFVLAEEEIRFDGGNKNRFHYMVVRDMPGGTDGFALTEKTGTHIATVKLDELRQKLTAYIDDYIDRHRPFPRPQRPMDLKNLKVIALVQDDQTGAVLQAAIADVHSASANR